MSTGTLWPVVSIDHYLQYNFNKTSLVWFLNVLNITIQTLTNWFCYLDWFDHSVKAVKAFKICFVYSHAFCKYTLIPVNRYYTNTIVQIQEWIGDSLKCLLYKESLHQLHQDASRSVHEDCDPKKMLYQLEVLAFINPSIQSWLQSYVITAWWGSQWFMLSFWF